MPTLIKDGVIATDPFQRVPDTLPPAEWPASVLVTWSQWQHARRSGWTPVGPCGVILAPDEPAEAVQAALPELSLIAIQFPAFADGRGYSTAYLLRTRYGFTGELRAIGDVFRDTLFYQSRVGFNAFELPDGHDAAAAIDSLRDFAESYQHSADARDPIFARRRHA